MRIWVFLFFFTAAVFSSEGMYMEPQLKKVPIGRLLANFKNQLAGKTNNYEAAYHLARIYSMAYATNLLQVEVYKQDGAPHYSTILRMDGVPGQVYPKKTEQERKAGAMYLTNAIFYYEDALALLRNSKNTNALDWMILPLELGHAWCLDQGGRKTAALEAYRQTLKLAWAKEVVGDFDFKKWVADGWTDLKARKNPVHPHYNGHSSWVCYGAETTAYLLKILDPVKDAKEIAQLKKDLSIFKQQQQMWITPLLIPLQSDLSLVDLVNPTANVAFDLDGSGVKHWGWPRTNAAWLVYDFDGKGHITSGLQLFGNVTFWIFWRDGYDALSSLDDNGDGVLRAEELRGLALWQDLNSNGISDPGEVKPLADYGITEISCRSSGENTGCPWNSIGVKYKNGTTRPTYDWIVPGEKAEPLVAESAADAQ